MHVTSTNPARFCAGSAVQLRQRNPTDAGRRRARAGGIGAAAEEPRIERRRFGGIDGERRLCPSPRRRAAGTARRLRISVARRADGRPLRGGRAQAFRRRHRGLLRRGSRQRPFDRMADELVDTPRVAEANFDLLRMHVHVDPARMDVEPQRVRGLPVVMQDVAIRFAQCVLQHAIADEAAIDEIYWPPPCAYAERTANPVRRTPPRPHRPRRLRDDASAVLTRACRPPPRRCTTRPLCCSVKAAAGCASATRRNASSQ
jgi:hypothetical protein